MHACVYVLSLHSAVSHEFSFTTNTLHKIYTIYIDLLRLTEEIELLFNDLRRLIKRRNIHNIKFIRRIQNETKWSFLIVLYCILANLGLLNIFICIDIVHILISLFIVFKVGVILQKFTDLNKLRLK